MAAEVLARGRAALEQARSTWARAGLSSYRYAYDPVASGNAVGFQVDQHRVVTVRNGVVTEVLAAPSYQGTGVLDWRVEGLLRVVESNLSHCVQAAVPQRCETAVSYDARLGYPLRLLVSFDGGSAGWVLGDFQAL